MLRQPRPKSQPPIKFSNQAEANNNDDWASEVREVLIDNSGGHRFKQLVSELDSSQSAEVAVAGEKGELELSSTSSSSSSLASSSLSLSTNSSTSTVLAALSTIQRKQQQLINQQVTQVSKSSMIARYNLNNSNQKLVKKQATLEHSEDDEDEERNLSSSSSSSSSGLSSMNSSTSPPHGNQESHNYRSPPAELRIVEEDLREESEVSECLEDLVNKVTQQVDGFSNSPYERIGLHEAILAETSQQTTSSDSSGDEEISFKNGILSCQVDLVQTFELKDVLSDSLVLHLARQFIRAHQSGVTTSARLVSEIPTLDMNDWFMSISLHESLLKWGELKKNESIIYFSQFQRCLVDQQLVVLIYTQNNANDIGYNGEEQLETTLDDIAMALDEPISDAAAQVTSIPAAFANCKSSAMVTSSLRCGGFYKALVCLFSSEEAAGRMGETLKSLIMGEEARTLKVVPGKSNKLELEHHPQVLAACEKQVNIPMKQRKFITNTSTPSASITYNQQRETNHGLSSTASALPQASSPRSRSQPHLTTRRSDSTGNSNDMMMLEMMVNSHEQAQGKEVRLKGTGKLEQEQQPSAEVKEKSSVHLAASSAFMESDEIDQEKDEQKLRSRISLRSTVKVVDQQEKKVEANTTHKVGDTQLQCRREETPVPLLTSQDAAEEPGKATKKLPSKSSGQSESKLNPKAQQQQTKIVAASSNGSSLLSGNSHATGGLSSYYKSVASKVLSNGQSRIRSLRNEMIKLNNRSATNSKRNSQQLASSQAVNGSAIANSKSKNSQKVASNAQCSMKNEELNQKQNDESNANDRVHSNKFTDHQRSRAPETQVPVVKPRTSILKNKQQLSNSNNGCDKSFSQIERERESSPIIKRFQTEKLEERRASKENIKIAKCDQPPESVIKPRSILKSSKSITNILNESEFYPNYQKKTSSTSNLSDCDEQDEKKLDRKSSSSSRARKSSNNEENSLQHNSSHLKDNRRRSTYSLANEPLKSGTGTNEAHDVEGEDDYGDPMVAIGHEGRDLAFERMRQRASCYDISRLMSKNCLENQLNNLRSGSTSSIAVGRSRQRRPALFISSHQTDTTTPDADHNDANELSLVKVSPKREEDSRAHSSAMSLTSMAADGTVRAKVTSAQLRSSMSIKDWPAVTGRAAQAEVARNSMSSNSNQGGRRQQQSILRKQSVAVDENILNQPRKKSEFDPRSLRRLPQTVTTVEVSSKASPLIEQQEKPVPKEHKSSIKEPDSITGEVEKRIKSGKATDLKVVESDKEKGTDLAETNIETETDDDGDDAEVVQATAMSKKGPFSILRQSFNQKTFSNMLKFSGRASLRVKQSDIAALSTTGDVKEASGSGKSAAIALAEANLVAAKQLKLQAQKLKEQQKRDHQQQGPSIDSAAMMLAAVQYNQHIQRQQQQQQQQQLLFQQAQQFAVARGQMFDASSVHLQHQMIVQQQRQHHHHQQHQQQQMSYLNSAHYMAQQMVMPASPMLPLASIPAQPMVYLPPGPQVLPIASAQTQPTHSSGILRKSILKGKQANEIVYPGNVTNGQQQLIPMAVNHHSSFNIVYTGSSSSSQIPQLQQYQPVTHHQHPLIRMDQEVPRKPSLTSSNKYATLTGSMRKTMKSILTNSANKSSPSAIKLTNITNNSSQELGKNGSASKHQPKLKSALKSTSTRDLVLGSEGSDGDGSSSDSTTTANSTSLSSSNTKQRQQNSTILLPKSALKETSSSSASSDSSYSLTNEDADYTIQQRQKSSSQDLEPHLTRNFDHRQSIRVNQQENNESGDDSRYYPTLGSSSTYTQSHRRKSLNVSGSRKNVTFSTKLTSIL